MVEWKEPAKLVRLHVVPEALFSLLTLRFCCLEAAYVILLNGALRVSVELNKIDK